MKRKHEPTKLTLWSAAHVEGVGELPTYWRNNQLQRVVIPPDGRRGLDIDDIPSKFKRVPDYTKPVTNKEEKKMKKDDHKAAVDKKFDDAREAKARGEKIGKIDKSSDHVMSTYCVGL